MFLSRWCENTAATIRELAAGILASSGPIEGITWLLPQLVLLLNTRRACFFKLRPFNSYQEWQVAPTGVRRDNAGPSTKLLGAVRATDWDALVSDNNTARPQNVDGLLLIPIVHHNHCIACLGIETDEAHSDATVHLLSTAALMLGEVLGRQNKENQLHETCDRQRETLIREVHHRIKNNLQGILGLLRQELDGHPALASAMENAITKVRSIAIVHGLQSRAGHGEIYLCEIVEALVNAVREVSGRSINLGLETRINPPLKILPEEAVPVALILNELLTNAIKHAGGGDKAPDTFVEFTTWQDRGVILIRNTAPSTMKDFDLVSGKGLGTGLELIRSLLPHQGANLTVRYVDTVNRVEARLVLTAPIILLDDQCNHPSALGGMPMTV